MIGLFASKSFCDGFEVENGANCLEKYHSSSSLLAKLSSRNENEFQTKSSLTSSSSTVFSLNSLEAELCSELCNDTDTDNDFCSLNLSINQHATTNEANSQNSFYHSVASSNKTKSTTTTIVEYEKKEFKKDLKEIISKYTLTQTKKNKSNQKKIKTKKNKKSFQNDVTKELAMFKVKRNYNESPYVYAINDSFEYDSFHEAYNSSYENEKNEHDNYSGLISETFTGSLSLVGLYINNMDSLTASDCRLYIHSKQLLVGSLRPNKQNKTIKLKTLLKNKNISSLLVTSSNTAQVARIKVKLNRNSLLKAKCKLSVKYNLYTQLNEFFQYSFVSPTERCRTIYSNKSIDLKRHLDENTLKTNKLFHKQLNLTTSYGNNNQSETCQFTDPPIVVTYSIDNNRINNELNQTYDQMYLEFLISLQHRDITPEDYEYLSRLDELVKKKTVNDIILNKLRYEQIDLKLMAQLDQDQCGICLDIYAIDQFIKYLPCGHRFHSECIDAWLRNQSTDCPLDKMPVDGSKSVDSNDQDNDDELIRQLSSLGEKESIANLVNEIIDQVELKCILERQVDEIVNYEQAENFIELIE